MNIGPGALIMRMKSEYPCAVSIRRYRQAKKEGKAPPRFRFKAPPEALAFAEKWGVAKHFLTRGSK